jgi:LemA protein
MKNESLNATPTNNKTMAEKKPFYLKPWVWILAIVLIFALWIMGTYNNLISLRVGVDNSWANVQTQYQRRFDLIPTLVNTTIAYAKFEQSTLTEITQLRSQVGQLNTQFQSTTDVNQKVQIAQQSDAPISRLLAIFENYPQLQTIQAVRALQDELSGTENRIAVARMDYNNAVASYDAAIQYFPASLIASSFGFTPRTYFNATSGAANPVPVPGQLV